MNRPFSALPCVPVFLLLTGCFSAPSISGSTQEVVATFSVVDGDPEDDESPEYGVGDSLPVFTLVSELTATGLSGTLTVTCTLSVEITPSDLTADDTGSDGVIGVDETVTRTFSLTDELAVWDCGNEDVWTLTGDELDSVLEVLAGDAGSVPVSVWVGDSRSGGGSLTYVPR